MITYITTYLPITYRQMSLEEFLFEADIKPVVKNVRGTDTRTYTTNTVNYDLIIRAKIPNLVRILRAFNEETRSLREVERESLYRSYHIPKRSGGLRRIDEPVPELMDALRRLKTIFEEDFGALYHTSAFAYVKKRCAVDAVKRHQKNESKWFGKYDLSNFFGSTTLDFVMKMLSMIFPFSEVVKTEIGEDALKTALSLAFLNNGLPQGTPVSPLITNVMMIPVDHKLSNELRSYKNQHFVYTRYADDFLISSKYDFDYRDMEKFIVRVLEDFKAPFSIKTAKTRYGSSSGSNWNLGVMLNKDNKITIGHRKKRQFQAMLSSYAMDKLNGKSWNKIDVQVMNGLWSYYSSVEGGDIDNIINHLSIKFKFDIKEAIKEDLRA